MTEQIKNRTEEATKHLGSIPFCRLNAKQGESVEMAIRSLQAWEEVIEELEGQADFANSCGDTEEELGIKGAIEIIKQKLADIE